MSTDNMAVSQPLWSGRPLVSSWAPVFTQGPFWPSFEQFRLSGVAGLEDIKPGLVGTLRCKSETFHIVHDTDFQKLVGLSSEVHRLKGGITLVVQAARVVALHPEQATIKLLIDSVSMLSESCVLPERDGHGAFEITSEEAAENDDPVPIKAADVPRPTL